MPPPARRRLAALAAAGALTFAGCAGASTEPSSGTFIGQHEAEARNASAAVRTIQSALAGLSRPPTRAQLEDLEGKIARARRRFLAVASWSVSENGEEEDVSQAETELNEAAAEMLKALTALRAYTRAPTASQLALYDERLRDTRARWNQGVSQIWFVAHRHGAPTF